MESSVPTKSGSLINECLEFQKIWLGSDIHNDSQLICCFYWFTATCYLLCWLIPQSPGASFSHSSICQWPFLEASPTSIVKNSCAKDAWLILMPMRCSKLTSNLQKKTCWLESLKLGDMNLSNRVCAWQPFPHFNSSPNKCVKHCKASCFSQSNN